MPKAKSGQELLYDARVQEFMGTVRAQCRKCNVKFTLANAEFVGGRAKGEQLLGFFWEPSFHRTSAGDRGAPGELRVAVKNIPVAQWIVTLAHEYAHFLQWFRDDPIYHCDSYLDMEIAAEREAFAILRQFGIPIDYTLARKRSKQYIAKIRKEEKENQ